VDADGSERERREGQESGAQVEVTSHATMNAKQTIRRQYCNMTIRRPQYSVYDISHI
jgi:hypothetical protein